jgi:hypothetical protein
MSLEKSISSLFVSAKERDEFEFICSLINYKGLGSKYSNSNLYEWFEAIPFYEGLYNAATKLEEKARLGLLIYSTFFESSDLYNILGSLGRVSLGFRSSSYLYFKKGNFERWYGTGEKISMIEEVLIDSGFSEIQDFFTLNHHKSLRNAFFHSSYSFEDKFLLLHDVEPIYIDNLGSKMFSIEEFLFPRVGSILMFFNLFSKEFNNHYTSYISNKIVKGRFPEVMDIEICGSPKGLRGFKAGRSHILLRDSDFWEGMNIRFDFPTEVDRYVMEEIQRFSQKDKINTNDGALERLYEIIQERNIIAEKLQLAIIYLRFATILKDKGLKEENGFKKRDINQRAVLLYNKVPTLNPELAINHDMGLLKYVVASNSNDIQSIKDALDVVLKSVESKFTDYGIKNVLHILSDLNDRGEDIILQKKHFEKLLVAYSNKEHKDVKDKVMDELNKL